MARTYTTGEVSKMLGVSQRTLYRWLYAKLLREPKQVTVGRAALRVWTVADIKRASKVKAGMARGRRPGRDGEPKGDGRLLALDGQLSWYVRAGKLSRAERRALEVLRQGLERRMVKAGVKW